MNNFTNLEKIKIIYFR